MPKNTVRTVASVERALRKTEIGKRNRGRLVNMDPYVMCRVNPFAGKSHDIRGVPDGSSNRRIMAELRSFCDFSFSSGEVAIRIMPMLQTMAAITSSNWPNTNLTLQGSVPSHTGLQGSSFSDWIPICFKSLAPDAYSPFNPYNAARARIVTVGWKLHYVGKALDAMGVWTVRPVPIALDSVQQASTSVRYVYDIEGGYADTISANNYMVGRLDFGTSDSIQITPDTVMIRPETNPHGVLRHTGVHTYKPYYERPVVAIHSGGILGLNAEQRSLFTVPRNYSNREGLGIGFNFVDTEFDCTELYSASAYGDYRLEVTTCVEYDIQPQSTVYPLTVGPPKQNQHAIAAGDASVQAAAVAIPGDQSIKIVNPPSTNSVDAVNMQNALNAIKSSVPNATAVGQTVKQGRTITAKPVNVPKKNKAGRH